MALRTGMDNPTYDAKVVGKCLQLPSTQGNAGQGDAGQNALISIYDGVVENVGMLMPRNDTEDTSQEVIARGLSLAGVSAEVPNSEGMVRYDVWLCDVFYFIFYTYIV